MSVLGNRKDNRKEKIMSSLLLPIVKHYRSESKLINQAQNNLKPIFVFEATKTESDSFIKRRSSQQTKEHCKCLNDKKIRKSIGNLFDNRFIVEQLDNNTNNLIQRRQNKQNFVLKNKIIIYTQFKKKQQEKMRNCNKLNIRAMCNLRDTLPNILLQYKCFDYIVRRLTQKSKVK